MSLEEWVQYGSMVIAVTALIIKRTGMKEFVPVGLFASFYANLWCIVAATYHLWHFPSRIITALEDISVPANFVVVPIMAMFWVRYCPLRLREKLLWAFIATGVLTLTEFLLEKYSDVLMYQGGYNWYHSYLLWFFSWFVWYGFHIWINNGRRDMDSLFK
ncbi:hypothetical protein DCCM_3855 [Desulfocucumis palustris]|uniref:Uncharacterized protein n=1 Tax=Desulfocucumis palustris TaxID=1898651 RepID=A0A2L2XES3_9FIRM|nr:CBO0543 family protein [Desulfocucumis palustris]GBF34735.1 hypothetical protein DCCM_3855 [Desulfocucumis palustris]